MGTTDTVDMSTICALRVDSLNVPAEFHGRSCPSDFGSVGFARWILRAIIGLSEEQFVGSTVGPDPLVVLRPVEGHDV